MDTTWTATPEQEALVVADVRSWFVHELESWEDSKDAEILAHYRNIATPEMVDPTGNPELDAAWIAVLTPVA